MSSPEPATAENGYAMTGAPLIVNGVVIIGVAGAEFSHRGFLEGYDAKTGKHLWRLYTVPAKGEPGSETWEGDSQLTGGGSSWVTGTYDPELDLVYWGIGNPAPWNPRARKGDNLFTNSVFAVRPKTGERVWYFQTTPQDPFDYDAVQTPVIATINVGGTSAQGRHSGQPRRLPLCARCQGRQADRRQPLRQGELGERDRHEDRTPDGDGCLYRRSRGQDRHGLAVGLRGDQLAAHVVQPAHRDALHQHVACRHDLSGGRSAEADTRTPVRRRRPSSGRSSPTIPTFAAISRPSIP